MKRLSQSIFRRSKQQDAAPEQPPPQEEITIEDGLNPLEFGPCRMDDTSSIGDDSLFTTGTQTPFQPFLMSGDIPLPPSSSATADEEADDDEAVEEDRHPVEEETDNDTLTTEGPLPSDIDTDDEDDKSSLKPADYEAIALFNPSDHSLVSDGGDDPAGGADVWSIASNSIGGGSSPRQPKTKPVEDVWSVKSGEADSPNDGSFTNLVLTQTRSKELDVEKAVIKEPMITDSELFGEPSIVLGPITSNDTMSETHHSDEAESSKPSEATPPGKRSLRQAYRQAPRWVKLTFWASLVLLLVAIVLVSVVVSQRNKAETVPHDPENGIPPELDIPSTKPEPEPEPAPEPAPEPSVTDTEQPQETPAPVVVCVENESAEFLVNTEMRDCAWLATSPANQLILCRPEFPPHTLCPVTCQTCV